MDRDQQRQNKRNTVSGFSCTAGSELIPLQSPTGRPGADCDPKPAAPVPFAAATPPPCPPPLPVPLNLPPGLTVSNDTTTAYCPSTGGYSVTGTTASTVNVGEQQQIVLFTSLENITENQLNYLYEVVPTSSTAIIAAALSGATSTVINLTHLNYAQSEELIITIQDAKFTVNTLAVEQARNLLVCQVENSLQAAQCPSGAYFGPTASVPPGLPYVPSATSSTGSVLVTFALTPTAGGQTAFTLLNIPSLTAAAAQANSLALAQAESTLRCVYGNAATAAACCTSEAPGNNLGFTYCVPATGPTIPDSATAVGYFSVPQNTIFSVVSATEANSVARELSRNSLNCYFPSVGITATCAGTGSTSLGLTGLGLTGGPFAPASTTSIYLEPGSVILYDLTASVTAASEQAATLALASLNCFWSNAEQTDFCPPSGTFTAINNIIYNLAASETASANYSSTVPADTVISYVSYFEANQQALQLARANLSCTYCNNVVPATCSGGVNATIGAEEDLVCNVLAEVAQNTAISLGSILVNNSEGGINCCYGNDPVQNTLLCGPGALYDPNSTFTSADNFFLPANIITVCQSTTAPPPPPLLFSYASLFATDVATVGCCSDIQLCGGITGSLTALPTIWAEATNLFSGLAIGATFYTDESGTIPYAFPAGSEFVVSRSGARYYRSITGSTGYTDSLAACTACQGLTGYSFRGATLGSYASASAAYAYADIFCGGPTAQNITLYTPSLNPFADVVNSWYLDSCGLSAFNPVVAPGASNSYYAGNISGNTGKMLVFSIPGGNTSALNGQYNTTSCPVSKYAYSVYVNNTTCSTASGATTLYGTTAAPNLFTSYTGPTQFYTQQFNDSSVYSYTAGTTGYINYVAPDTTVYSRVINGSTAGELIECNSLYSVTVQWSNTAAADVCNYPNHFDPSNTGIYNSNIRSLWCDVENPFANGASAIFYTSPFPFNTNKFKPGVSGTVYLSQFTPGDTYRNAYREYTWSNTTSALKSYTGAFKSSPFLTSTVWAHSATANLMGATAVGNRPYTKFLLNASGCTANATYSDIKIALPQSSSVLSKTYKTIPFAPVANDLYSNFLLFDGIGYELSSNASGTASNTNFVLNDLTKVGAGFTGAIVRAANQQLIGNYQFGSPNFTAIPTYISSINTTSGAISLGGYYNQINTSFSGTAVYVTGFKIEAGNWTGSQFTCYGDLCNRVDVGHSLYSYYTGPSGPTSSFGYVTRVDGNTVYYTGAPGYSDFASYDIGTGASHGSGHVYIQGKQFTRFWGDDNKTQPLYFDLQSNNYNYLWTQTEGSTSQLVSYTPSKNLVLGNTAGSTASFIVAGINYSGLTMAAPRPYSYYAGTGVTYEPLTNQYITDSYYYNCDGTVDIVGDIVPFTTLGIIDSCCATVAPADTDLGGTVSACMYFSAYGTAGVDPSYCSATCDRVEIGNGQYWQGGTTLNGTYIVEGVPEGSYGPVGKTGPFGNGPVVAQGVYDLSFASTYFVNGNRLNVYPCRAQFGDIWPDPPIGFGWAREFIGYYNTSDPYDPIYPFDSSYPGGGTTVNSPTYFAQKNGSVLNVGYIFKDYEPAIGTNQTMSETGCNCGNFTAIEYSLTSGRRYSIWSTTAAAWAAVYQNEPGDYPTMVFNACTTGCTSIYTCTDRDDCDSGAPGLYAAPAPLEVISYSPSELTSFDFTSAPSVGGTAEDLKAEATALAQTLVNSFVRCYYLNDQQQGEACLPSQITASVGIVAAGEVVSLLSLDDANNRAQDIANSRTICLDPDTIGGPGCASTTIADAEGSDPNGLVDLSITFPKNDCAFNPVITVQTGLTLEPLSFTPVTICAAGGGTETRYLLGIDGNYSGQSYRIPLKPPGS
jgi:hypothetical protein